MSGKDKQKKKKLKTSREQMIQEALTSRILKEGWLNKRGGNVKTWKRRYFVIREHKCYYYKEQLTQKMAMRGAAPMGQVDFSLISSCDDVTPADIKGEKKNVEYFKLSVNTGRGFYLIAAPTADQKREWMDAFREALRLYKVNEEMWQARADGTYDPFAEAEKQRLRTLTIAALGDGHEADGQQQTSQQRNSASSSSSSSSSAAASSTQAASSAGGYQQQDALQSDDDNDDEDEDEFQLELPEELYAAGLTDESDLVAKMRSEELYKAVQIRRHPAIKALTGLKTSVTWRNDKEGRKSAVHLAAEHGDRAALQQLLPFVDVPLESLVCGQGWTPLHWAAYRGSGKCVRLLLQAATAPLLSALDNQGRTAAYIGIVSGSAKIAQLMIAAEIDAHGVHSCWSPVHHSAVSGDFTAFKREQLMAQASSAPLPPPPPFGLTLLHLAACSGSAEIAEAVIAAGQQHLVDAVDQFSKTAMHIAANAKSAAVINVLARHGASPDTLDSRSKTALHFAAGQGHAESVSALLSLGCDRTATDETLFTPLHTAAVHGCSDELLDLLVCPQNVNLPATLGYTPLFLAVHAGHVGTARGLIARGAAVDAVTVRRHSPLHEAASRGHQALVQLLLEHGANKNLADLRGYTPVHHAVSSMRVDCLDTLLQAGADASLTGEGNNNTTNNTNNTNNTNTPLCLAIELNSERMVSLLLGAGASVDDVQGRGAAAPLHRAIDYGHTKIVRLLIDHQHPLDIVDDAGISPLVLALRHQNFECAKQLIDAGCNVNFPAEPPSWRPIHEAASQAEPEAVELLLLHSQQLDVNWAESTHQLTALHIAAAHGSHAVTAALLKANADPNAVDDAGNKPIHYSAQAGHRSLSLLLCSAPSMQLSAEAQQLVASLFALLQNEYQATVSVVPPQPARAEALAVCRPSSTAEAPLKAPAFPPPPLPSSSRAASSGSSIEDSKPKRRETLSMQLSARTYIQHAQKMLSPENYIYFQGMLRDYKAKKLSIAELMQHVIDLFQSTYQPVLLRDFVFFIPDRYKETYNSKVQAVLAEMNA